MRTFNIIVSTISICLGIFNAVEAFFNRKKSLEIEDSQQAKKIYSFLTSKEVKSPHNDIHHVWKQVIIRNPSKAPIFHVFIIAVENDYHYCKFDGLKGLNKVKDLNTFDYIDSLYDDYSLIIGTGGGAHMHYPAVVTIFTDCMGKQWIRDPQGNLNRINCNYINLLHQDGMPIPSYEKDSASKYNVKKYIQ